MGNIERYKAEMGWGADEGFDVLDVSRRIPERVAHCWKKADAEKVARALNNSEGAVEALRLIAEDRVPYEKLSDDTAVPAKVREFARRAAEGSAP